MIFVRHWNAKATVAIIELSKLLNKCSKKEYHNRIDRCNLTKKLGKQTEQEWVLVLHMLSSS